MENGKAIALLFGENWVFLGTFHVRRELENVENGRFLGKMASL